MTFHFFRLCTCLFLILFFQHSFAAISTNENKSAVKNDKQQLQAPLLPNLGSSEFPITTKIPLAQRFFNQGLILFYGFEWGESIRSFQEATQLDPNCAICQWGLALALGAKANAPMTGNEYADAKTAIEKAQSLSANASEKERAYINALALRFQHPPKPINKKHMFSCHATGAQEESTQEELSNYADAMRQITTRFSEDKDAKALYAYALFDVIQWKFWDANGIINPLTPSLINTLEAVITYDKLHVGANHYYIHVMEQSPQPDAALANADRLKTLVPGSEHLVHMPTHIYFLTGRYHEGTQSNQQAIAAYKQYSDIVRKQGFEPEITYLYHHDFDFLRTTATMEGRRGLALSAARELLENLPEEWIKENPELQGFLTIPYYVMARFGMWNEILAEPTPNKDYVYVLGMWHYIRGLALAHTNKIDDANKELDKLRTIISKGVSGIALGESGFNLLKIANEILAANIASIKNNEAETFSHLKVAAKIQHDMGYHEPPDWYFPVKEAQGYAYLHFNHPTEAIETFVEALKQYPDNGWALYGLTQSLIKQGKNSAAAQVNEKFKRAWQYADIESPVSLF